MKTIFKKVIYQKDSFCVLLDNKERVFQGNLLHKSNEILNIPIDVKTEEITHKKYGKQYKIIDYSILEEPLSFFLRKVVKSGLPKETITEIADKYTLEEFKKILEFDENRLLEIKNLGKIRLKKIKKSFLEKKDLIELTEILSNANVTSEFLAKIFEFIKNKKGKISPFDIKKNPYILTQIEGVGFKKADSIALKLGISELDEIRISAYILYAINQITNNRGDTLHLKEDLFELMLEELSLKEKKEKALISFENSLKNLIETGEIVEFSNEILSKKSYLIKKNFYTYEKYIISLIENYQNMKYWKNNIDKEYVENFIKNNTKYKLSDKQKQAVIDFSLSEYPFFILAGYAGAGKTTTSKLIMDIYATLYGKENIIACALSGNASNRIKNVTGYNAKTIHSLLGYRKNGFIHNELNPLNHKLIVLDEASMVDIYLFYSLLKAIDFRKSKLFIIGDNAQLPPVGAGEVFSDMLEMDIQKVILDKVFRQSEDMVINFFAKDIREGKVPKNYQAKDYKDFIFYKKEIKNYFKISKTLKEKEKKEIRDTLNEKIKNDIKLISSNFNEKILKRGKQILIEALKKREFEKVKEISDYYISSFQIITPSKKGMLGTIELNKEIKKIFNPSKNEIYGLSLFDKVIHLKNKNKNTFSLKTFVDLLNVIKNYENEEKITILTELAFGMNELYSVNRVFNGQVGMIFHIENVFTDDEEENFVFVYYPSENYVTLYQKDELKNRVIDLAYTFTIHKSQGSEYKYVILPVSLSNAYMLNNKLLYTAITRAKKQLILIGESYAFEMGIRKKKEIKRNTLVNYSRF